MRARNGEAELRNRGSKAGGDSGTSDNPRGDEILTRACNHFLAQQVHASPKLPSRVPSGSRAWIRLGQLAGGLGWAGLPGSGQQTPVPSSLDHGTRCRAPGGGLTELQWSAKVQQAGEMEGVAQWMDVDGRPDQADGQRDPIQLLHSTRQVGDGRGQERERGHLHISTSSCLARTHNFLPLPPPTPPHPVSPSSTAPQRSPSRPSARRLSSAPQLGRSVLHNALLVVSPRPAGRPGLGRRCSGTLNCACVSSLRITQPRARALAGVHRSRCASCCVCPPFAARAFFSRGARLRFAIACMPPTNVAFAVDDDLRKVGRDLLLTTGRVCARDIQADADADAGKTYSTPPELAADIKTTFPDADILGVRLINGRPTKALIEVTNKEDGPISVAFMTGVLATTKELPADAPAYQGIVRNLTAVQYNLPVEAGETKSIPYSFALDMQPQDVRLSLVAVITNAKGKLFQIAAHDGTAAIVEAPTSFFDPQMYVLLTTKSMVAETHAMLTVRTLTASSSTSSSRVPSPARCTLSTRPGSRPCSLRLSAPSLRARPRRWSTPTPPSPAPSPPPPPPPASARPTTRAGSPTTTSTALWPSASSRLPARRRRAPSKRPLSGTFFAVGSREVSPPAPGGEPRGWGARV